MTELVTTWLLIVLALSLSCNLAYICRDMARENRRERRRQEQKSRDEVARGPGRR